MRRALLALGLLLACAVPSIAQVQPISLPGYQFFDDDGSPLAGGKICTYSAGTTTPLATYTDSTGSVLNTNPVILDSAGRATIWFGAFSYKVVVRTPGTDSTCSTGSVIRTDDNIPGAGQSVASNAWSSVTAATNSNAGTFAMSGNTLDVSGATIKVTHGAGTAPTTSAILGYDDTANKWVFGQNGATVSFGLASASACSAKNWVSTPATAIAVASCTQPAVADLSDTKTGTGDVVLATNPALTSPALTTPTIGGTTITNVPVMAWSGYGTVAAGVLDNGLNPIDTISAITILNFRVYMQTAPVGCSVLPSVQLYDETAASAISSIAMGNGTGTYLANVNSNVAASHILDFRTSGSTTGCSTAPDGFSFAVTYRMQ